MNEVNKIFELLEDWHMLPKYQLERRIDIFFALYLPEILKKKYSIDIGYKNIIPEFPIKKENNCASNNADYAILVEEDGKIKLKLIELKTDMNSIIKKNQIEYYKNIKTFEHVLSGIIKIASKTEYKEKYTYLLEKIEKFDVIIKNEDESNNWLINSNKIIDEVEIFYIVPEKKEKITKKLNDLVIDDNIITFEDITQALKNKKDDFSKHFCSLLSKISGKSTQ